MTTTAPLTLDEFLRLPETKPASEYSFGEVQQKPMPTFAHSTLQGYLYALILRLLERSPGGRVQVEWRCILGPDGGLRAFVPDVVYVAAERVPRGDMRRNPVLHVPPDLIIEVLSPDQPARQFADKLQFYLRHGVRLVWVVDPEDETVTVYAPDADSRLLRRADTLDGGEVLPEFALPLADLFAQLQA